MQTEIKTDISKLSLSFFLMFKDTSSIFQGTNEYYKGLNEGAGDQNRMECIF